MPVSVLEHVRGNKIPAEWHEKIGVKPNMTFKIIFVPDNDTENTPKAKVYSDDVKRIYKEAMLSLDEDIENGLTRETSFGRLKGTMDKIGDQIKKNK